MNLDEVAKKYYTDKNIDGHHYTKIYEKYFDKIKNKNNTILEIGVYNGESVKLWREYFSSSKIYAIDINKDCKQYEDDRIKIFIGNQSDINFLETVIQQIGELDIVIDDGSHLIADYVTSFNYLFPKLKNNGLYIIEDTNYDGGRKDFIDFIEFLVNGVTFNRIPNIGDRIKAISHYGNKITSKLTEVQSIIYNISMYNNIIFIRRD